MSGRFLLFIASIATLVFLVTQRFLAHSPWRDMAEWRVILIALAAAVLLILPFVTDFMTPGAHRGHPVAGRASVALGFVLSVGQGLFFCLLFYVFFADLAQLAAVLVFRREIPDPALFDATCLLTLGTALVGFMQATLGPRVYRVDIPVENLPPALEGFKIAQVSDLHVSTLIGRRTVEKIVRMVNALEPDIAALTGDMADGRVAHLQHDLSPLGAIRAPRGVFFILGNHEYYWNAGEWAAFYRGLGMRVLLNEHALVEKGGAVLAVAGVTDWMTRKWDAPEATDPMRAAAGIPPGAVKILLAHQPSDYARAEKAGFDLQLSGHTHGGQFFPSSLFIGLFHRYAKGLGRHGKMWVYVNRGAGFWGPPLRAGVPTEITLLTLRRKIFT